MYPDCDEILKLANDYDIIPVCREIYADVITPITLLRKLSGISSRYYLLESIEGGEKWGRYSFLGYDPVMRVSCKEGVVTIEKGDDEGLQSSTSCRTPSFCRRICRIFRICHDRICGTDTEHQKGHVQ